MTMMGSDEGPAAIQELINFLQVQTPLHNLQWSDQLAAAAYSLASIQGPTGQTGHDGPDGSTFQSRIEAQTDWEATIGENIMYNSGFPLDAVLNLAVDDGVASRGHRTNIFSADYFYQGCSTEMHSVYGSETVIDYMGSWSPDYNFESPQVPIP